MQLFQIGGLYVLVEYTVEPPISHHPRCKDLVMVAYGRWSLTRIEPQGSSSEKMYRHTYFMENNNIIYCMQFLSYNMCSSRLILKFFAYSKQHSTHSEHKRSDKSSSGRLQEIKNNGKSLNCKPQIAVVAVAYRRQSFTRGPNWKALTGKVLVLWIASHLCEVIAYESWSHMEVRLYCLPVQSNLMLA